MILIAARHLRSLRTSGIVGEKDVTLHGPIKISPVINIGMTAEEKLQAESAQLSSLRDWMLPMLMNG